MSYTAWIGLGGNIGDVRTHMKHALNRLDKATGNRLLAISSLYRTPPWGKTDQPWFLNAAAAVSTALAPQNLLDFCLEIEQECQRERQEHWGPRTLDIDLLFFSDNMHHVVHQDDARLTLPHPRIKERAFVLLPLAEIAPSLMLEGITIVDWLALLPHGDIKKIATPHDWCIIGNHIIA